jgi:hypothetical protein
VVQVEQVPDFAGMRAEDLMLLPGNIVIVRPGAAQTSGPDSLPPIPAGSTGGGGNAAATNTSLAKSNSAPTATSGGAAYLKTGMKVRLQGMRQAAMNGAQRSGGSVGPHPPCMKPVEPTHHA